MYRAIKVRIYPTHEQESYLAQCFGNTRWLWNVRFVEMES